MVGGIFYFPNLILVGDLNFTLFDVEIWGRNARLDHLAPYFSHLLCFKNMVDLEPLAPSPMWRNGHVGVDGISKRLDIFLASHLLIPSLNNY